MQSYYTGIGSRQTPSHILDIMRQLSSRLAYDQWILRSGGARGADCAFQSGCIPTKSHQEIYLPAYQFNGWHVDSAVGIYNTTKFTNLSEATYIAMNAHPQWTKLLDFAKMLMIRNVYQVLGLDLNTPSNLIICWTPDGSTGITTNDTGGTGQALRIAHDHNIPIINLNNTDDLNTVISWTIKI